MICMTPWYCYKVMYSLIGLNVFSNSLKTLETEDSTLCKSSSDSVWSYYFGENNEGNFTNLWVLGLCKNY